EVKNAVDGPTAKALADAFREFEKDKKAEVAVLWGDHGCFCAGANLKAMVEGDPNRIDIDMKKDGPMGPSRMIFSKPVIAAVAGYAVAGGLELAIMCDLRVVERDAVFGVFCRRFGVPLTDGGTVRLPRLIGLSRALDLILTGRPVYADEALAIGLANRVVDVGQSRPEAEKLAREIAVFPKICMREDRLSAYEQFDLDFEKAMENEFKHGLKTLFSGETLKGAKRFKKGVGKHGQF
ncbi:MAG: crotonase/enoyl-CoA hydratase family protein, partial [Candidatus Helarchaeota archaeon]|nr:crotonase/enoyl-CoA hydratase family protein [Candidatus Helarchaeota archaeon]